MKIGYRTYLEGLDGVSEIVGLPNKTTILIYSFFWDDVSIISLEEFKRIENKNIYNTACLDYHNKPKLKLTKTKINKLLKKYSYSELKTPPNRMYYSRLKT